MDILRRTNRYLLVDISNSFVKFASADDNAITGETRRLPTHCLIEANVEQLEEMAAGRQVVAASVVPAATAELQAICQRCGSTLRLLNAQSVGKALSIDYPDPASIGADRLANALAAIQRFGAPCVVVDFGTAVTFDIVDARGAYIGGVIAPGLAAMSDYLHEKTALLPRIEICEPVGFIGKSTEEAMRIGTVHGYRGMIRELLCGLRKELSSSKNEFRVIATGGYAELIASTLEEISAVVPTLTLEGLCVFANSLEDVKSAD